MPEKRSFRCAVYTRKSTDEGLEQDFNSLHAQREACEAYIKSQRHEGWSLVSTAYDDGGYSGGSMERPALKKLLSDINARKIDIIIVYKVDRLTRSLADFAKMVETFDAHGVSFVSVTQQFNTTTSMGRLTLNVLLSFAQFEREVTGERIRDKIAASKKKGMWMGGLPPPGYRVKDRKLLVHEKEAKIVRLIFSMYRRHENVCTVHEKLIENGIMRPAAVAGTGLQYGNRPFTRGMLYSLLSNPIYIGEVEHGGQRYAGQHGAIVRRALWDSAQKTLAKNAHTLRIGKHAKEPSLLIGLLHDASGTAFQANHALKGSKRYRYYVSSTDRGERSIRVPAVEIESAVLTKLQSFLCDKNELISALRLKNTKGKIRANLENSAAIALKLKTAVAYEKRELLLQVIEKIKLTKNAVSILIQRNALMHPREHQSSSRSIEITFPLKFSQRGVETRLIIEGDTCNGNSIQDPALIKSVSRAVSWFEDMTSGEVKNFSQLGRREGLTRSVVGRISLLAFLEPALVEQILSGQQLIKLRTRKLLREINIPEEWSEQRRLFSS